MLSKGLLFNSSLVGFNGVGAYSLAVIRRRTLLTRPAAAAAARHHKLQPVQRGGRRWFSDDAAGAADVSPAKPGEFGNREPAAHVVELADKIASLNMIESMDLVAALATKLGVTRAELFSGGGGGFGGGVGGGGGGGGAVGAGAAGAGAADAAAGEPEVVASEVTLSLVSIDEGAKFKVLKEVRKLKPDMPLIECKKLVEKLPATLQEGVPREEAEKIVKAIKEVGGVVELV